MSQFNEQLIQTQTQTAQDSITVSNGSTVLVAPHVSSTVSNSLTAQVVECSSLFSRATVSNSSSRLPEFTNTIEGTGAFWEPYEASVSSNESMFLQSFSSFAQFDRTRIIEEKERAIQSRSSRGNTRAIAASSTVPSAVSLVDGEDKKYLRSHELAWRQYRENPVFSASIGLVPLQRTEIAESASKKGCKGKPAKGGKSKEQICSDNALSAFENELDSKNAPTVRTGKKTLSTSNFVETGVVGVLVVLKNIQDQTNNVRDLHDAWFGAGEFLNKLRKMDVRDSITNRICKVHSQLIEDLSAGYELFVARFDATLSYGRISRDFAEFYNETSYKQILPESSPKPYQSQKELVSFVSHSIAHGLPFLATYTTIMGMGKTTSVAALKKVAPNKVILYVCPEGLKAVREKVGSLLHQQKYNFALVTVEMFPTGANKLVIKEQNDCKKSAKGPEYLLAGVEACIEIFKQGKPITYKKMVIVEKKMKEIEISIYPENILVFFDEPTVTLDEVDGPMVAYLSEFYSKMPPCVIFSSATHPSIEKLDQVQGYFASKHANAVFKDIDSSFVKIGTQLNTMSGQIVIPHKFCNTPAELERFINIVDGNLMYKKSYTFSLGSSMYDKMIELGLGHMIAPEYHFTAYMDNLANRNQMAIGELGLIYLGLILEQSRTDPDIIHRFNAISATNVPVNYDDLVGTASLLKGQTFISCIDPYAEMMSKFGEYLASVKSRTGHVTYAALKREYEEEVERVRKTTASELKGESRGLSKNDRERLQGTTSESVSINRIPASCGLNGITHSLSNVEGIPESIEYDNLMFMTLLGVVVYRKNSHKAYHDMVIRRMSSGQCVYVFADSSLNYGNSFPFNNGIILDEMSGHSANTLLQLMGRAGRPGRSAYATIYAGDAVIDKLLEPIYNPEYVDMEIKNIKRAIKIAEIKDVVRNNKDYYEGFVEELKSPVDPEQLLFEYIENLEAGLQRITNSLIFDLSQGDKDIVLQVMSEVADEPILTRAIVRKNRLSSLFQTHPDKTDMLEAVREISVIAEHHRCDCFKAQSIVIGEETKKHLQLLLKSVGTVITDIQKVLEDFIEILESGLHQNFDSLYFCLSSENKAIINQVLGEVAEQDISTRSMLRVERFKSLLTLTIPENEALSKTLRKIVELSADQLKTIREVKTLIHSRLNKRSSSAKDKLLAMYNDFVSTVQKMSEAEKIDDEHLNFYRDLKKFREDFVSLFIGQLTTYGLVAEADDLNDYTKEIFRNSMIAKENAIRSIASVSLRAAEEVRQRAIQEARETEEATHRANQESQREAALTSSWRTARVQVDARESVSRESVGRYQPPRGFSSESSSSSNFRSNIQTPDVRRNTTNSSTGNEGSWRRSNQNQNI